jgi:hypothetical protein
VRILALFTKLQADLFRDGLDLARISPVQMMK